MENKEVKKELIKQNDVEVLRAKVELLELKAKQFRALLTVIENQQKDAAKPKAKKETKAKPKAKTTKKKK
jgi:hypothetical protein